MKIMNKKRKKGFTLIELIVVIAILAILAAVAVPNFIGITDQAKTAQQNGVAAEYANAINIYNVSATSKINSASMTSYATLPSLAAALSTLAPSYTPTDLTDAAKIFGKIVVSTTGVATIDKSK